MVGPVSIKGAIPDSVVPYPDGLFNKAKYAFWKLISPGYVWGMNVLLRLHIIHHHGRQEYLIGTLAPGTDFNAFLQYLAREKWTNHFIAWHDDDQLVSVRKLVSFTWQYHLRIFKDGEVRGHYEYTPESHPRWHLKEVGMEKRREDFLRFMGDWIVPVTQIRGKSRF